nr:EOG090X0ETF [Macrothrix elegans]
MNLLSRAWILLISLALIATLVPTGRPAFAYAEEDEIDNDDAADAAEAAEEASVSDEGARTEDDDSDDGSIGASADAETTILFTKPTGSASPDLPAGQITEFLVGFTNKGAQDMVIETVEAAFHYPMDHTFVIQNFSAIQYFKVVKPKQQATVAYSFIPAEPFAGRPFGLSINLAYRDSEGRAFRDAVFNETINITEVDEGLDGETFFLYLFLAAGVVLLLVLGQQALSSMGKRRGGSRLETGTSRASGSVSDDGIDYDWLPKETINQLNKSPKGSPRRSPRLRKTKGGSSSE